jgi:predicted alpha/beta superfamily hydrolase
MTQLEELILKKTLETESKIVGLWREDNGEMWTFNKIEDGDREGQLFISYPTKPPTGRQLKYEIIWVSDSNIYLNIIMTSVPKPPDQYKIEFIGESMGIYSETLRRSLNKA